MKQTDFLNTLMCPAFLVKDGHISYANVQALQRNITQGIAVADYISIGSDEYKSFTQGKLSLTLEICGTPCEASVTVLDDIQLFCLETQYQEPELRAFALVAQQLRGPLSSAMTGAELLLPDIQQNKEAVAQLAQINRNLHRILRAVSNMSDASLYKTQQAQQQETSDVTAIFSEFLEKVSVLAEKANRTLNYKIPNASIVTLADRQKLERAVLNMLSNALRYSPEKSTVFAELKRVGKRLYFTVENTLSAGFVTKPFFRYLREPGLESEQAGIGLGMSIIHSVASSHGGTLLIEQIGDNAIRSTMTLAIRNNKNTMFRSPILLPTDYAGGKDRALLELSDILPDCLYTDMD